MLHAAVHCVAVCIVWGGGGAAELEFKEPIAQVCYCFVGCTWLTSRPLSHKH